MFPLGAWPNFLLIMSGCILFISHLGVSIHYSGFWLIIVSLGPGFSDTLWLVVRGISVMSIRFVLHVLPLITFPMRQGVWPHLVSVWVFVFQGLLNSRQSPLPFSIFCLPVSVPSVGGNMTQQYIIPPLHNGFQQKVFIVSTKIKF